jgi:hypothetical protein
MRVLAVARHENARRQVDRVGSWLGPDQCARLNSGIRTALGASAVAAVAMFARRGRPGRVLRIIRSVDARHGFLVACRVAEAIAWYARSRDILLTERPGAVLVSSDSNPEEAGFLGAARALEIPRIFISHAYPTPLSPPLDFSLSILEGEAAVEARRSKGAIKGDVLFGGVEGESGAMAPRRFATSNPVIGIFTSKALSWATLASIIADCRHHCHARQILIRWHPSMLERPRLAHVIDDLSGIVETPRSAALVDVARRCDWVIADENSNVHLPVLKLGIPTVAVKHLGMYPESRADQYGFVANQIILPPVTSIRDVRADALVAFYSGSWPARFERYDASYMRPAAEIQIAVRRAIRGLYAAPALPAMVSEVTHDALDPQAT